MSKKTKEYLVSTGLTFLTGVLIVVGPALNTLTVEQLKDGTIVGILMSGLRLGLKMALEMFINRNTK